MTQNQELGEFLRSRRARLRPPDVGLIDYGGRRRVPGLRREELSQLAGVSATYYTRLEQGQCLNASDAVLGAIARVLGLDEDEHAYLCRLARPAPRRPHRFRPERLRPALRVMIDALGDSPALVLGRWTDVLAWNRAAHALLAGHLAFEAPQRPTGRPNVARLVFLDAHTHELYADWRAKCRDTVADLRRISALYPDDPRLTGLIGELTVRSPEFAALWSAHPVRTCAAATRDYHHPVVGTMTLSNELLCLPDDEGQRVAIYSAQPGSPSEAALALVTRLGDDTEAVVDDPRPREAVRPSLADSTQSS